MQSALCWRHPASSLATKARLPSTAAQHRQDWKSRPHGFAWGTSWNRENEKPSKTRTIRNTIRPQDIPGSHTRKRLKSKSEVRAGPLSQVLSLVSQHSCNFGGLQIHPVRLILLPWCLLEPSVCSAQTELVWWPKWTEAVNINCHPNEFELQELSAISRLSIGSIDCDREGRAWACARTDPVDHLHHVRFADASPARCPLHQAQGLEAHMYTLILCRTAVHQHIWSCCIVLSDYVSQLLDFAFQLGFDIQNKFF